MKVSFILNLGSTGGYVQAHVLPELGSLFIKIFVDVLEVNPTPAISMSRVGDSTKSVFTATYEADSFDHNKCKEILEKLKFYNKYNYSVDAASLQVDDEDVYVSDTNYF